MSKFLALWAGNLCSSSYLDGFGSIEAILPERIIPAILQELICIRNPVLPQYCQNVLLQYCCNILPEAMYFGRVYISFFLFLLINIVGVGTCYNCLIKEVLTSISSLCYEQKYEKYQNFLSENFHFLVVKFSAYLNRRVFVMVGKETTENEKHEFSNIQRTTTPAPWYIWSRYIEKNSTQNVQDITKTYLYNFDPLKLHFYIVKLGFTGVYVIFLISARNTDCGYSLEPPHRGGSNEYPQSMFWAEIWKISDFFIWKIAIFCW